MGPNMWSMGTHISTLFKPDVSAPGVDIYSSIPGNSFDSWAGTSMAAPHVTAAVALWRQANPKGLAVDAIGQLILSVDPVIDLSFGHGILNLPRYVESKD